MRRSIVPATVVLVVLAGAAGVWLLLVRGVSEATKAPGRLAGELLAAHVPVDERLARTLLQPGLHLTLVDRAAGVIIDAGSVGVSTHPLPPGAGPPGEFPPGMLPPDNVGIDPMQGRPDMLPGGPGGGPPGMGGGRPRAGAFAEFALWMSRISPIVLNRGDTTIEISADARVLALWLGLDLAAFSICAIAIGGLASTRAVASARADRKALEARLLERREAADRYQRFLAETGHELRTPLTVMTGYVEILRRRNAREPLDERIVEGMHAETSRMRVLVEKMLTLARLESAASVPRLLDVATAAREAVATAQRRYPEREIRVDITGSTSIVIDADDYAAALGNLVENAIKYAPESPIVVETSVGEGEVSTSVIDRGPGVAQDERDAIFERFHRGRGRTFGEGLGVGLTIVKRVAERWNGSVDLDSRAGRTAFTLTFPTADEELHGIAG
jgi:signal transduction histidine kinase